MTRWPSAAPSRGSEELPGPRTGCPRSSRPRRPDPAAGRGDRRPCPHSASPSPLSPTATSPGSFLPRPAPLGTVPTKSSSPSNPLRSGQTFSVKGQRVNTSGSAGHTRSLSRYSVPSLWCRSHQRQHVKERAWLCPSKAGWVRPAGPAATPGSDDAVWDTVRDPAAELLPSRSTRPSVGHREPSRLSLARVRTPGGEDCLSLLFAPRLGGASTV